MNPRLRREKLEVAWRLMKDTVRDAGLLIIVTCVGSSGMAQTSKTLGQPVRSAQFAAEIAGREPRCENGFCLVHDLSAPTITIYRSNGTVLRTNDLGVPGSVDIHPMDMSISRSGLLAASAGALNADGSRASLIMLFTQPGPPSVVIRTDPFVPIRIVLSQDGHVWALGWNPGAEANVPWPGTLPTRGPQKDYGVFQEYTLDGQLAGEFVMRSTLPRQPLPHAIAEGSLCALRASATSIGAYVPASREWIEIQNNGNGVSRLSVQPPSSTSAKAARLGHLAITDSGSIYANWSVNPTTLYVLNRGTATWQPISGTSPMVTPEFTLRDFIGCDGNLLLFKGGPVPDSKSVVWFNEP